VRKPPRQRRRSRREPVGVRIVVRRNRICGRAVLISGLLWWVYAVLMKRVVPLFQKTALYSLSLM